MILTQRAVGTFSNYEATERALHELKENGFLMEQVLVVGRDMNRQTEVTGANTTNRLIDVGNLDTNEHEVGQTANKGAVAGGTVGGLAGLLIGLGIVAIPGVGPIMLAGAAATTIATALSGTVIGAAAGSLAGGLAGLGIPADRAKFYSDRIFHGDYLVMVEGSDADIDLAKSVLSRHGIEEWYIYDLPDESVPTVRPMATDHTRVQTIEEYPEKSLHLGETPRQHFTRVDTKNYS